MAADTRGRVGNTADEAQVKTAGDKDRLERKRELDDLRAILSTEAGRRLIYRIAKKFNPWEVEYVESPTLTNYIKGQQFVACFLIQEAQAASYRSYELMMSEAHREAKGEESL